MFTDNQQIALAIIPKITASISISALAYAIHVIASSPQRRRVVYKQLFIGCYISDILRCSTYVTGTWMVPRGTEGVSMAMGNQSTCAVQSFVAQLGSVVPLYTAAVFFYFYIAIKHDFNNHQVRWAEKWCHILPITLSLLLSIMLLVFQRYGVDGKQAFFTVALSLILHKCCTNSVCTLVQILVAGFLQAT